MVTFEEVRENSDDEEVSTKEGLNYWNYSGVVLQNFISWTSDRNSF